MGRLRLLLVGLTLCSAGALAQATPQDEVERQLRELVGNPPTKILINFVGLDEPQFRVAEATFVLDGTTLPGVSAEKLNGEGEHLIWHGDVKPGPHKVEARVTITDVSGALFSYEAGFKWNPDLSVAFKSDPGIEVQVNVTPKVNRGEKDPKKRISLSGPATIKMLAKLEDGTLPPPPKPNLPVKEVPDAGVVVAALTPAEKAKQAADEKKRLKEEAAAAAAEKKAAAAAAAEEKKAAALAAAEEKKRQREEAKAAALAAAEEKKRLAAGGAPRVAVEPPPEVVDAGPAVAEAEIDAGAPVVAVVEPPKPVVKPTEPPKPPPEEPGLPWPLLAGGALAVVGLIIFLLARRRSNPQLPP